MGGRAGREDRGGFFWWGGRGVGCQRDGLGDDGVHRLSLNDTAAEPAEGLPELIPVETVVHDALGIVPVKGTVLAVEIGQGDITARLQSGDQFFNDGLDVGKVVEGHRRKNQVELLTDRFPGAGRAAADKRW